MHTLEQIRSGKLNGAKHIQLSCQLTEFPKELFDLSESLEILDLSINQLNNLPDDFHKFKKLKILFCSDNKFTELPEVLGKCESLEMIGFKSNQISYVSEMALPRNTRWLILTNNKLEKLPISIGNCLRLQKVALAGNQLNTLPQEMAHCQNLELLRISANQLHSLPEWLLQLPKLAWLAFAGNTFNAEHVKPKPLQELNWKDFTLLQQLGEGASGHIYKALWRKNEEEKVEVAIKVFKGEVTSDGFPEDEMQACIAAGVHPNLYGLLGSIVNHPQQKMGLVMNLIPPRFKNLGLPPSFETCTRDTFALGTKFTVSQIHQLVFQMAQVSAHLHAKGILHGDLYTHNCLVDESMTCLLGDFGAATFYNPHQKNATEIQKMEVRALACLLDDLLFNVKEEESKATLHKRLCSLRDQMIQKNVDNRPNFETIVQILDDLND